jgi:ubiquinone/menaquinone biosynthesis C-methylase UbiE
MTASFDATAQSYDLQFTESLIGQLQRAQVWEYFISVEKEIPGQHGLELNCGTGEDALFLAGRKFQIMATDASEKMLQIAKEKIESHVNAQVEISRLDLREISAFFPKKKFDFVFSNFGGLNCISFEDLDGVLKKIHSLLNENGRFIIVLFGNRCLWEQLYFFVKLRWGMIFRRLTSPTTYNWNGEEIKVWYHSFAAIKQIIGSHWKIIDSKPVGLFVPPSYLEKFFAHKKPMLDFFQWLDSRLRFSFLASRGDHFIIDLKKQ